TSAPFDVLPAVIDTAVAEAWALTPLASDDAVTGLTHRTSAPGSAPRQRFASDRPLVTTRWETLATHLEARVRHPGDSLFAIAPHTVQRRGPVSFVVAWDAPPRPGVALELRLRPLPGDTTPARILYAGTIPDTAQTRRLRIPAPAGHADWIFQARSATPAANTATTYPLRAAGDSLVSAPLPRGRYVVHGFHDRDHDGVWNPGSIRPWIPQETYGILPDTVEVD